MRTIITATLFSYLITLSGNIPAQTLSSFIDSLVVSKPMTVDSITLDTIKQGDVSIYAHSNINELSQSISTQSELASINGYRIRIFFDNSQSARSNALKVKEEFEVIFPDIQTYLSYENPYFKVTVGNCVTIDETTALWGKISTHFNRAFITREDISIEEIHRVPTPRVDSTLLLVPIPL